MTNLTFKRIIRKKEANTTERNYFDFIISGKSLSEILDAEKYDLIGIFGWIQNKVYENQQIEEFIGNNKSELKSGRIPLYVCPECGDISCGAITSEIEFNENQIIWKNFGYENEIDEIDFEGFENIGPYIFDKSEYVTLLESLKN